MLEGIWDPRGAIWAVQPSELGVVLAILAVSLLGSLPCGILAGLVLLSLLFVLRYSHGDAVEFAGANPRDAPLQDRREAGGNVF